MHALATPRCGGTAYPYAHEWSSAMARTELAAADTFP